MVQSDLGLLGSGRSVLARIRVGTGTNVDARRDRPLRCDDRCRAGCGKSQVADALAAKASRRQIALSRVTPGDGFAGLMLRLSREAGFWWSIAGTGFPTATVAFAGGNCFVNSQFEIRDVDGIQNEC